MMTQADQQIPEAEIGEARLKALSSGMPRVKKL